MRIVVAVSIGLGLAVFVYQRAMDPMPRQQRLEQRQKEEAVVFKARDVLRQYAALGRELKIVDPLEKNRAIGKVYVYPAGNGWQVSGHYQRQGEVRWYPWLITLDERQELIELSVPDPALQGAAQDDPRLTFK